MAKFCTKCGKELEEGKTCNCENKEVKKVTTSKLSIGDLLKQYLEIAKEIFTKPIDTLKKYASEDNFNLSLVSIAILGLVMGLFVCLLMKNSLGMFSSYVEIPYVKVFIASFVSGVLSIGIMAVIAYVISDKFLKCETTIKKMLVLFGLSSTILSATLLVAALCSLIGLSATYVYAIVGAGAVLNLCYNVKGLEYYTKINENMIGYVLILTNGITTTILYFIIKELLIKILY